MHADDHLFKSNPLLDDYEIVGESELQVIHSLLAMSWKEAVYNVLVRVVSPATYVRCFRKRI
jgi:hypothetical protein